MNITDFVWVCIGEFLLAATFAMGILVGASLKPRKESNDGNSYEGTSGRRADLGWYSAPSGAGRFEGGARQGAEAHFVQRPHR